MLIKNLKAAVVFSTLLLCLVSAFSTRFLIEGMGEEGKIPMEKETKTTKIQKNDSIENKTNYQGIEMEVIPIVTDIFSQPEDLFNMTPLKLVAAISAQHLIETVKNIPVAGNTYEDSLDMLENIVKEFNKTAEIIKLTAKYVNISGHYMLSTLKEFTEENCDVKSLDDALKSVRKSFLKTITDHAVGAVKELNEKTKHREISGSDILISSSYHIVSAFQEMTNKVLSLTEERRNTCKQSTPSIDITPPSEEKSNVSGQMTDNILTFQPILQQGKQHKSMKKDQAQSKIEDKFTETKFDKFPYETLENVNNQDITVELYSPETVSKAINAHLLNQKGEQPQLKVPEDVTLEFIPLNKILPQKTSLSGILKKDNMTPKINNFEKFQDGSVKNSNNQDLTVEVFSSETNLQSNIAHLLNQKYKLNKLKDLKMEIIPLKNIDVFNMKNILSSEIPNKSNMEKTLKKNNIKIFQDKTNENDNKHKFTVEVLSPETILSKQKGETSKSIMNENNKSTEYNLPNQPPLLQQSKNSMLFDIPKESPTVKTTIPKIDKELDSSAVDSLSNVPWGTSSELETAFMTDNKDKHVTDKSPFSKTSILNIFDLLQNRYPNPNVKNTAECDERMQPVCGFDEKTKKLIIFMNDCKREAHNSLYKTNYSSVNMDNCVSLFLRNPADEGPLNTLHRTSNMRSG